MACECDWGNRMMVQLPLDQPAPLPAPLPAYAPGAIAPPASGDVTDAEVEDSVVLKLSRHDASRLAELLEWAADAEGMPVDTVAWTDCLLARVMDAKRALVAEKAARATGAGEQTK